MEGEKSRCHQCHWKLLGSFKVYLNKQRLYPTPSTSHPDFLPWYSGLHPHNHPPQVWQTITLFPEPSWWGLTTLWELQAPFPVYRSWHERKTSSAIKPSTVTLWNKPSPIFPSAVPKKGIINYFLYCRCQHLSYLSLLSKSLLVSASKSINSRFIIYWCVYSFYYEIYVSKSSFIQTNTLLKGSS